MTRFALSKKCKSLKQRMMIDSKNHRKGNETNLWCTSNSTRSLNYNFLNLGDNGKDEPCVMDGSAVITFELADLCANSLTIDYDINFKDNENVNHNNSCEICGQVWVVLNYSFASNFCMPCMHYSNVRDIIWRESI